MKPVTAIFTLAILTGCGVELSHEQAARYETCVKNIPSALDKDIAIATGRCKAPTYLQSLIARNLK